ncbi:MAG TPA: hypothetical protein PKJ45_13835 [Rubrivivax sp.]|nr:hypothetical protein [Rubrivivax sp.]
MTAFEWDWVKVDAVMRRDLLRGASSGARAVADYAEAKLQASKRAGRTVTLDKVKMAKELGVSLRSIQRAIAELVERSAIGPHSEARGCDTYNLAYARAGMNQAERDEERAKQQAADKRKSARMQQAPVLNFKRAQTDAEGEQEEAVAA